MASNVYVLSLVGHKEQRFMSMIFPLFALYWGFFWAQCVEYSSYFKWLYKLTFWVYLMTEIKGSIQHTLNFHPGDREIYNLIGGRSNLLTTYDYSKYQNETTVEIKDIESLYFSNKYDSPNRLWSHRPGDDNKVTVTYIAFLDPNFVSKKYLHYFTELLKDFPQLRMPQEPGKISYADLRSVISLLEEFESGGPLPQIVLFGFIADYINP